MAERATGRVIWQITGQDALPFLQGLVSNDVRPLGKGAGIVWAALLTPQGKYLADFLVVNTGDTLLIDIAEQLAPATLRRLMMYRLRADVQIVPIDLPVARGLDHAPTGALPDPRHPALGWRAYGLAGGPPMIDWDAIRVANMIPESGRELIVDDSYILEFGFEALHGVDFRKGCYVGQEVTARMKHKTELRKGLARVRLDSAAAEGDEITADDKPVGRLHTVAGNTALAYLRLDRADGRMRAGSATLWRE
ncbi:MAG: YgfZ/GcvT domain-containing protein [Paracoccaceae bacterium]